MSMYIRRLIEERIELEETGTGKGWEEKYYNYSEDMIHELLILLSMTC